MGWLLKQAVVVCAFLVGGMGCASSSSKSGNAAAANQTPPDWEYVIHSKRVPGQVLWGLQVFEVGGKQFKAFAEFKTFVDGLPQGSTLRWDSGCIAFEKVPLREPTMTLSEFEAYCKARGIKFKHVFGY